MNRKLLFPVLLLLFLGSTLGFFLLPKSPTVSINGKSVSVTIADDRTERQRGLSGKELLAPEEGMLFIFENPGQYSFWMKEMNFPIDIIFIGEDRRIVQIFENVAPETFPQYFRPGLPAKYVLEVSAGWVSRNGIISGQTVDF